MDNNEFGRKLKLFAKRNYGGVVKLSERLGMTQAQLSNYIIGHNKPGLEVMRRLGRLGCDLNWLINDQESELEKLKQDKESILRKLTEIKDIIESQ